MRLSLESVAPKLVLLGLSLAVVLPPFGPDRDLRGLAFLLTIFGALLQVLGLARRGLEPSWLGGRRMVLAAVFLLGAVLVSPLTAEGAERLMLWTAALIGGAVLASEGKSRTEALRLILVLAGLLALQALAERLYLFDGLRGAIMSVDWSVAAELEPWFASHRARVSFGQANGLAAFLVLFLPLALRRVLVAAPARLAGAIFGAILLGALWASGSRGGLLAAATAVGLALAVEPPGRVRNAGRVVLALTLLGWIVVLAVYLGGEALVARDGAFQTLLLRRDYARTAIELGLRHAPFGCGLELFGEAQESSVALSGRYSRFAHQLPLGLLAELGLIALPGLLLLGAFARGLLRSLHAGTSTSPPPTTRRPFLLAPALTMGVLGGSLGFLVDRTWIDLALVLGLALLVDHLLVRPLLASFGSGDLRALAAGALGLLLHAQVDFDLRIASVTAALALVAVSTLEKTADPAPRSRRGPILVLVLLAAAFGWVFLRPVDLQGLRQGLRFGVTKPWAAEKELDALPERMSRFPGVLRLRDLVEERR